MPGRKRVIASIAVASLVILGFAQVVSTAVKTVTEPIAMKHGTVLIAVTVWLMKMIYAMSAINVSRIAVTVTTNARTAEKSPIPFALVARKNAPNVQRMKYAQIVENIVRIAGIIGAIPVSLAIAV